MKEEITAQYIYDNYADKLGLVETKVIESLGWTVKQAEEEGLVIKENYHFNKLFIVSKIYVRKGRKNGKRNHRKIKKNNKTLWDKQSTCQTK